jgi:hypothetical protein
MSEHFERLQDHLRQIKEASGIDLLEPRGISIFGKIHPARNKYVSLEGDNERSSVGRGGWFEAEIPFENGTHAAVAGQLHDEWRKNKEMGVSHLNDAIHYAAISHGAPVTFSKFGKKKHSYGPYDGSYSSDAGDLTWQGATHYRDQDKSNPGEIVHYKVGDIPSMANDRLKKWSQMPLKGYHHKMDELPATGLPPTHEMTQEELMEHHRGEKDTFEWLGGEKFAPPHIIHVRPNFGKDLKTYHVYNVQTEQLHDTGIVHPGHDLWD